MKGYYTGFSFMGWDPFELCYKEFVSDTEYYEFYYSLFFKEDTNESIR